jgi:5-methylcytosine-specific restriction endonuclease McrA
VIFPKPARRGPKPRRPIKRKAAPRRSLKSGPLAQYRALVGLCDDTYSLIVRLRARGRCRLCGSGGVQCAHLISRRYFRFRWSFDSLNAWGLCARCHKRWTEDPLGWDALMVDYHGEAAWRQRCVEARVPTRPDLSVLRFALRRLLEEEVRTASGPHAFDLYGLADRVAAILNRHDKHEGRC